VSNVLGWVVGFGIRTALWLQRSSDVIGEEEDGRICIECCVFLFHIFHM
jgi:hypothetical protein